MEQPGHEMSDSYDVIMRYIIYKLFLIVFCGRGKSCCAEKGQIHDLPRALFVNNFISLVRKHTVAAIYYWHILVVRYLIPTVATWQIS